jgi:hypothetical protein
VQFKASSAGLAAADQADPHGAEASKPSDLPPPGPDVLAGTLSSLRTDLKLSSVRGSGMLCMVSIKRCATG